MKTTNQTFTEAGNLLRQARELISNIEWTTNQCDNGPLGEHLNALDQHIENAIGRLSTVARAADLCR